jgi:hypothetical protein
MVLETSSRWPGQRQPTPTEVARYAVLLASDYPRQARDGGRLKEVR